jgi:hypothetical protein
MAEPQSENQMSSLSQVIRQASWFKLAWKSIALAASTGAALVTVFSALYSYGVVGKAESHQSIGNIGAAWVGLRPGMDTAAALGDTIHFAATISDKNGSILVGARPTWTTGDTSIATVLPNGSVIARKPGITSVNVVVGTLVANSKVVVKQRVASVEVGSSPADSFVVLPEGAELRLSARALDARGHPIAGMTAHWSVDDSSVAAFEKDGVLTGRNTGRTVVIASVDGVSRRASVAVVTTAAAIGPVAGGGQRAFAGNALPQPIVVRATSRRGAPAPGQLVSFRLVGGQGSVEPATAVTDADGRARTMWTLGDYPGRQTLLASVAAVDSATAIVAEADPVAANTRATAVTDVLVGRAGEALADSMAVRVTDSTGRALADVPVRWTPMDGGTVESGSARTDSLGVARAYWTLAPRTGVQRLRAQVGGGSGGRTIPPVTITARAMAGAPAGVLVVSGDDQRGPAGAQLKKAIALRVVDVNGSGVANAAVVLSPSGGILSDSTLQTDSLGLARTHWTLGHSAGEYTVAVHLDGVNKLVKLSARATPATPANLSFDDAPPAAAAKHGKEHAKGTRLFALVTDVYGNPVPDAKVVFSTKSGTVKPTRAVSDTTGRVALTWAIGSKGDEQTLIGKVASSDVTGTYVAQGTGAHEAATKPTAKTSAKSTARAPAKVASKSSRKGTR